MPLVTPGEWAGLDALYVTSEKFTNEIINAIRYQKTEEFRTKYRQIDILLVDNIQFIAGKSPLKKSFSIPSIPSMMPINSFSSPVTVDPRPFIVCKSLESTF